MMTLRGGDGRDGCAATDDDNDENSYKMRTMKRKKE